MPGPTCLPKFRRSVRRFPLLPPEPWQPDQDSTTHRHSNYLYRIHVHHEFFYEQSIKNIDVRKLQTSRFGATFRWTRYPLTTSRHSEFNTKPIVLSIPRHLIGIRHLSQGRITVLPIIYCHDAPARGSQTQRAQRSQYWGRTYPHLFRC